MAISMAIHEIIITFFSLLAVNLSKKTAPAKKKNSKKLINELKPTKTIFFPQTLFNGVLTKRIASTVDDIQKQHPEVELMKAQYLNRHELIIDVFMERALEVPFLLQCIN